MIILRPPRPDEGETLARLFTASRKLLDFLPQLHTPAEDIVFITTKVLPAYRITVAEVDGAIAGYMADEPHEVQQLYLDPGFLRQGIGTALMNDVKARNDWLALWCFEQNHRGRAFYTRHGFVEIGRSDGDTNPEGAADIRFRWQRG
ncbi:GNAT family N-acetyltransferase [Devosia sp.]|uniref:GNAT family N-acetyltransferase n=1 Tax=Devosia sp. TaxID=1871048 RepID=UPI003A953EC4